MSKNDEHRASVAHEIEQCQAQLKVMREGGRPPQDIKAVENHLRELQEKKRFLDSEPLA